ncbi:MAG: hypothetical protein ACE5E5_01900 [Phycisphaerae bacterium]
MVAPRSRERLFLLIQRRMIHETELALLHGLRFPERYPSIPKVEVGKGTFDPEFAASFWESVLELDAP